MTARYALAWSTGASVGLLVGAILGQSVRDLAALSAARRTLAGRGTPQPLSGHGETTGAGNGAQTGAQRCDAAHPEAAGVYCSLRTGHRGWHTDASWRPAGSMANYWQGRRVARLPTERDDDPYFTDDDSEVDA